MANFALGRFSSSFSEENLNSLLSEIFGCDAEVTDGYEDILDSYKNEGTGNTAGGDVTVLFTRDDETYEADFTLAVHKDLYASYSGAMTGGLLSFCWDDVPDEIKEARPVMESYEGASLSVTSEQMNAEYLEAFFRQATGLTDSVYSFHSSGIGEDGQVTVYFMYVDSVTGQAYGTGMTVTLESVD